MDIDNLALFEVGERIQLKKFIEAKGHVFEKGRGFYQLTKKETIQDYKCVVARRKVDGKLETGAEMKEILKISNESNCKVTVDQDDIPDFDIFVQSTSYNRVILPGTKVLYRIQKENRSGDMRPQWDVGLWLGKSWKSDEHVIARDNKLICRL